MNNKELPIEVYLDNTTMIGAAQLIYNPAAHLSAYTLLDLETFCEAFILFDRVISLRQQSIWYLKKVLSYDKLEEARILFKEMRAAGVFSTRSATFPELIGEDLIDNIANNLALDLEDIFNQKVQLDGYLIKAGAFAGTGMIESERSIQLLSLKKLLRPVIRYFVLSMYEGKPYYASSIRAPIVRELAKSCNHQGISAVNKCLEICEKHWKERIEKVKKEFDGLDLRLVLPPLLKYVLEQCKQPSDIGLAILKTRNRRDVRRLRSWFRNFQRNLSTGNVDEIYHSLENLDKVSPIVKNAESVIVDIQAILTITASPLENIFKIAANNTDFLYSWIRNRHFVFIKNLMASTNCIQHNQELIKKVFGVTMSNKDLSQYANLRNIEKHTMGKLPNYNS